MKELSIEEKAQRYDEALNIAKEWYNDPHITIGLKGNLEDIFPELKESEDERIRKEIISIIYYAYGTSNRDKCNKLTAWLEKQGEQKSTIKMKTPEESLGIDSDTYNKIVDECIYGEQKPDDKVEPKFKVGDWVVQENIGVYKVIEVCESWYEVVDNKDKHYSIGFDKEYICHLWTVADAKDGDVLYAGGSHCYFKEYLLMFSSLTEDNVISTHFGYDVFHGTFDKDITRFGREEDFMFVTPATKEQRDLLFAKMKEASYEWSSEHRKLIKK